MSVDGVVGLIAGFALGFVIAGLLGSIGAVWVIVGYWAAVLCAGIVWAIARAR